MKEFREEYELPCSFIPAKIGCRIQCFSFPMFQPRNRELSVSNTPLQRTVGEPQLADRIRRQHL